MTDPYEHEDPYEQPDPYDTHIPHQMLKATVNALGIELAAVLVVLILIGVIR